MKLRPLLLALVLGVTTVCRAGWSDAYTLGAGDILDIAFYGRPELDRAQVFVQPDGTLSYLQVQNLPAAGLTIDALRSSLETALARFHRQPRLVVAPVELRSKHFVILGKVVDKGSFPLDRPTTILEAVARARGIETGLFEQNTVELADLPRSFLMRRGARVPVDFEALFLRGDLSQNVALEPDDYLYFPSAVTNEVYVLGEVAQPGILGVTSGLSTVGAIAIRGGFTRAAYRQRILIVRGSLAHPERIVVDAAAVLAGRQPDVLLQPKDIVYVSARPWRVAEELLDVAITTFLQASTSSWALQLLRPSGQ